MPSLEDGDILIDAVTLRKGEEVSDSCEHYNPLDAEIPFDCVLDRVTGRNGSMTEYFLLEVARCPTCKHETHEKTPVDLKLE